MISSFSVFSQWLPMTSSSTMKFGMLILSTFSPNLSSSSAISFLLFAAPHEDVRCGDSMKKTNEIKICMKRIE